MSSPERIDPERLAALIDGRLNAIDAAAVRAQLANADDETLMAFVDASMIVGELESETPHLAVSSNPATPRTRSRTWLWGGAGLLAAAAIVLLFVRGSTERDLAPASTTPAAIMASAGDAVAPDALPWPTTRGAESGLLSSARAVRLGVLLADADAPLTAASVRRSKIDMAGILIREIPGGSAIAPTIEVLSDAPTTSGSTAERAAAETRIMTVAGAEFVIAGAWLEGARIALTSGRLEFFNRSPAAPVLLQIRDHVDDTTRATIESVIAASKVRPVDPHALQSVIDTLLETLTR